MADAVKQKTIDGQKCALRGARLSISGLGHSSGMLAGTNDVTGRKRTEKDVFSGFYIYF